MIDRAVDDAEPAFADHTGDLELAEPRPAGSTLLLLPAGGADPPLAVG